jgi:hypothetical protein
MAIYYIDSYGSDTELLVRGIVKTVSLAKSSKLSRAAVAAHDKKQVSGSNIWEEAIGKAATKSLGTAGKAIINDCTFHLITERIDPADFIRGPILAAAIATKFLERVIKNRKATDIVFVPWTPEELEEFKRNHPEAISF